MNVGSGWVLVDPADFKSVDGNATIAVVGSIPTPPAIYLLIDNSPKVSPNWLLINREIKTRSTTNPLLPMKNYNLINQIF